MRIRELAKELDIQSKVILEILEKKGVTGKTPASNISGDEEEAIRNRYKTSESDKQKDIETAVKTKDETVLKNKNNETSKTGIKEVSSEIKDEHSDIKKTAESTSENVQNQENISKGDISIKTDKLNAGYKTDNVLAGQKNKIMAVFRPQNAEKSIGQYQKETDKKDENRRKNKKNKNDNNIKEGLPEENKSGKESLQAHGQIHVPNDNRTEAKGPQNNEFKKDVTQQEKHRRKKENKIKHTEDIRKGKNQNKAATSILGEALNKLDREKLKNIIIDNKAVEHNNIVSKNINTPKHSNSVLSSESPVQSGKREEKNDIDVMQGDNERKTLQGDKLTDYTPESEKSDVDITSESYTDKDKVYDKNDLGNDEIILANSKNEKEAVKVSVESKQADLVKDTGIDRENSNEKNNVQVVENSRNEKALNQAESLVKGRHQKDVRDDRDGRKNRENRKLNENKAKNQQKGSTAESIRHDIKSVNRQDNKAENKMPNRTDGKSDTRRDNKSDGRYQNKSDNRAGNRSSGRPENKTGARYDNRADGKSVNKNENRVSVKGSGRQAYKNDNRNGNDLRSDSRADTRKQSFTDKRQGLTSNSQELRSRAYRDDFSDKDKDEKSNDQRPRQNRSKAQGADKKNSMELLAKKTSSNRINKNNFKNSNKLDKKHRTEDGPSKGKVSKHPFIMPVKPKVDVVEEDIKEIVIPEIITIKELAAKLKLQPASIVKKLFLKGSMVTINSEISFQQAEDIALEYDVICTLEEKVDVIEELLKEDEEDEGLQVSRPPVVCVMGHVDHGKTSLLDAIRKTNVSTQEAGGITQHIGAYMVSINGQPITFLDTPGHEAFTAMRMRGALSTDIAILVVAADDGVMPQTVEAISHARAAGVEIIVAVNKIDKESANIDRVKQELSEYDLIPEDWGGQTIFCPVSAHTKEGIENLLEMIILTAEVKELKANPNRRARGLVIEAELDKGKGPVATILVQKGTLNVGDFIAAGACSGKVRAMINDKGQRVKTALPSTPVEILGLDNVPNAGEVFVATENDKEAKAFAATFISESKNKLIEETKAKLSLDDLFSQIKAGNVKELPIIVKADVQGSVEAVKQSLSKLSNEEVAVKVIHGGVGAVNESDVALAAASNAIIIGFNVRPDSTAKASAEHENVDLRLYKVIYKAIEDIEAAMKGMLEPVYEERIIGHAEVRQLFKASGVGTIAGSYVLDGKFQRGCKARIIRDGDVIFDGNLASLKRFKDDVKEVAAGYECGLVFEKFNDLLELDQVEAYIMAEVSRA